MLKTIFFAGVALLISGMLFAAEFNSLTEKEKSDGWVLLFDGKTLDGWKPSSDANWQAKDGIISVSSGKPGLLCTTKQYDNYELSIDFRCPADTNSGIFLRTPLEPKNTTDDCYELNIAPSDNPFPTGGFVKRQKAEGATPKADDWNTFHVLADHEHFLIELNGKAVLRYKDPQPKDTGFIGLQLNQGPCEFRNIKLKPLTKDAR